MKKVLWLIVCLMTMIVFSSCSERCYLASAKYEVCYPDGTQTYEESVKINCHEVPYVVCYSFGGTNYISVASMEKVNFYGEKQLKKLVHFISSTSPMRLVGYNVIEIKKEKPKNGEFIMNDMYMTPN